MSRRCDEKAAYRTMGKAELMAAKRSLLLSELLIAYECCDCGRYHVGHADESQKAARAETELELQQAIFKNGLRAVRRAAAGKSISTDPLDASRSTVDCSCKQGVACGAKRCKKRRARQRRRIEGI